MPERFLTAADISRFFNVRGNAVYYLLRCGRLRPATIIADHAAFHPDQLPEILNILSPHMSAVDYARALKALETRSREFIVT
jgi:hypothetical protein